MEIHGEAVTDGGVDDGDKSMTGRGCCSPPASGSTTGRTAMEIYDEILLLLLLLRRSY